MHLSEDDRKGSDGADVRVGGVGKNGIRSNE